MWTFLSLERLLQDLRYAARIFAKTPAFSAVAIFSIALGIGGNAAMFSLVNALLIRPLPYVEPDRLIRITGTYPRAALPVFQQQSRTMNVAAASTGSEFNLAGQGEPVRVFGSDVSANFFTVLGSPISRGRTFKEGEDSPGRDGVVVLSHSLWKGKFASDSAIIGRVITLNGVNRQVIGITPPDFAFPSAKVQLWVPMRLDPSNFLEYWAGGFVPFFARLRPGATAWEARGEIHSLITRFRRTFPYPMARSWNANASAIPLQQDLVGDIRGRLIILLCSVALVLFIACVNVASLLLSRATVRRKEIALRAALGAGRSRIVGQLLTESVLLALVGGGLGLLLGSAALSIFKSVLPSATPGIARAVVDWHVVAVAAALALCTGLAFGIAPAWSASQIDLTESIKTGSQRSTAGIWAAVRSWLIAGEVALTVILVVSAALLMKSLYRLSESSPGFNPGNVLMVRISPNQFLCKERSACVALYQRILEHARNISGVTEAAVTNTLPLDGEFPTIPVDLEGHPKSVDYPSPMLWFGAITPEYFHILRIPLLAGREFTQADGANSARVLLVTASTARRLWPGEDPIGKHIKAPAGDGQWRTVVGVLGDVRQYSLSKDFPDWVTGALYMPYAQSMREDGQIPAAMTLLAKTSSHSPLIATEIRSLAQDQAPDVPVGEAKPLEDTISSSISDFRSTIRVFMSFAGIALLLAAIGIYGLVSYWVTQRTYEIGLRLALGATRPRILTMILTQSLRVTLYGIFAGLFSAFLLTRYLGSLLYGVAPTDPMTFGAVAAVLLGVAITATGFPAWKAARIDPVKSLRVE
ncbi:MAG: ABC transporter permease [Acidobacteriaceae bacterium]|nr:ABC transporter permease [Acidobacteriaceae bacterium]